MTHRPIAAARLVILISFLDLFIQLPVVAPHAVQLGAGPAMVGLIVGAYSAMNLVGNLVCGVLLDRLGRRDPILIGLVLTGLALVSYAVATTPEALLAARLVHGLATSVLTPGAFALIGDAAPADRRAGAMGRSSAIIAFAAVLGPPLAGVTRDRLGIDALFVGFAALTLLAAAAFWLLTRASSVADRPATSVGAESPALGVPPPGGYRSLWTRPRLGAAFLAALALTVGVGTLVTHLPLTLVARGESASRTGLAFTIYAAVGMILMLAPTNRLSDRHGRSVVVAGGLALLGVGLLILGLGVAVGAVALGMAVFGLGFGLLFPAATLLVAESAHRDERGAAFGIFYAVYSLGVVIGSLMSGVLNQTIGQFTGLPFLLAGAVAISLAPVVHLLGCRGSPIVPAAAPIPRRADLSDPTPGAAAAAPAPPAPPRGR